MKQLHFSSNVEWISEDGKGTHDYTSYSRDHLISGKDKYTTILGSSDPAFKGDATRYNPEDLFLASLSSCHMLWYLHFCADNNIIVTKYTDNATGILEIGTNGIGQFNSVTLHPVVTIDSENNKELALSLHHEANKMCFIANSCNFEIKHLPTVIFVE